MASYRKIIASFGAVAITTGLPIILSTPFTTAIGNGATYAVAAMGGIGWLVHSPWLALPAAVLGATFGASAALRLERSNSNYVPGADFFCEKLDSLLFRIDFTLATDFRYQNADTQELLRDINAVNIVFKKHGFDVPNMDMSKPRPSLELYRRYAAHLRSLLDHGLIDDAKAQSRLVLS